MKVRGFKAMRKDLTCRKFKFEISKTFIHDGEVKPCESGFHFCEEIEDVFTYYDYDCRIFEVEADDIIVKECDKTVTNNLTILKEIDYNQYIDSKKWRLRASAAYNGFGLEKLVNDINRYVRYEVAKQGYGLDIFN